MNSREELQMQLPATPEAIPRVRREVEARALALGISEKSLYDLKTVVSEACTNVVRYAYEDEPGPLEVEMKPEGPSLKVLVRDRGCGIAPKIENDLPSLHMGLPLIGALSSRFVLSSQRGVGTEIEIHVPLEPQAAAAGLIEA